MRITDILTKECVRVPLQTSEKVSAITELVDLLNSNGLLDDRNEVLGAVLAREATRSTGVGFGLAVPHGKSRGCRDLVMAVGKPAAPIEFQAPDGRPCNVIVLLASPVDKTGPHIQALAGISRLWQTEEFRVAVAKAAAAEDLYNTIAQYSP